jgi:hypothetical protein
MPLSREVLAVLHGEPRRMGHKRKRPSFETPRKRAAPQDDGFCLYSRSKSHMAAKDVKFSGDARERMGMGGVLSLRGVDVGIEGRLRAAFFLVICPVVW